MTMRSLSLKLIVFSRPHVSGSTSGKNLGGCATLGFPPWLIPPHSVGKPYTYSPPSSIVTIRDRRSLMQTCYLYFFFTSTEKILLFRPNLIYFPHSSPTKEERRGWKHSEEGRRCGQQRRNREHRWLNDKLDIHPAIVQVYRVPQKGLPIFEICPHSAANSPT